MLAAITLTCCDTLLHVATAASVREHVRLRNVCRLLPTGARGCCGSVFTRLPTHHRLCPLPPSLARCPGTPTSCTSVRFGDVGEIYVGEMYVGEM